MLEYEVFHEAISEYLEYRPLKLSIIDLLHKGRFWSASWGGFYPPGKTEKPKYVLETWIQVLWGE